MEWLRTPLRRRSSKRRRLSLECTAIGPSASKTRRRLNSSAPSALRCQASMTLLPPPASVCPLHVGEVVANFVAFLCEQQYFTIMKDLSISWPTQFN
jgi:hypothetical protein